MKQYDYVIVGSGLFAGVWAYLANKQGKKCLVIEKRDHLGGNIYCEDVEGIHVHKYGAHIFHTSNREVGILSTVWQNLTATPTARWLTTRARCTICHLI